MNGDLLGRMLTGAARMGMAGWQAQQPGQQPGQPAKSPQQLLRGLKQPAPASTQAGTAPLGGRFPGTYSPTGDQPSFGPKKPPPDPYQASSLPRKSLFGHYDATMPQWSMPGDRMRLRCPTCGGNHPIGRPAILDR